jgi:hypothetical protein
MSLAPGARLDGYEILGPLGSGGMGDVYRARDSALKREVAIKVLPPFVSQDPDRLRRFQQEAQAAAALNHPNILAVFQFGTFENSPYLVSELLEGDTLRYGKCRRTALIHVSCLRAGEFPIRNAAGHGPRTGALTFFSLDLALKFGPWLSGMACSGGHRRIHTNSPRGRSARGV